MCSLAQGSSGREHAGRLEAYVAHLRLAGASCPLKPPPYLFDFAARCCRRLSARGKVGALAQGALQCMQRRQTTVCRLRIGVPALPVAVRSPSRQCSGACEGGGGSAAAGGAQQRDPQAREHPTVLHTMVAAVAAALSLQLQASAQASSASTSGRPWAPLRPSAVGQQLQAASGRRQRAAGRRMSATVQAVAAEPAVAANGTTGACQPGGCSVLRDQTAAGSISSAACSSSGA